MEQQNTNLNCQDIGDKYCKWKVDNYGSQKTRGLQTTARGLDPAKKLETFTNRSYTLAIVLVIKLSTTHCTFAQTLQLGL